MMEEPDCGNCENQDSPCSGCTDYELWKPLAPDEDGNKSVITILVNAINKLEKRLLVVEKALVLAKQSKPEE